MEYTNPFLSHPLLSLRPLQLDTPSLPRTISFPTSSPLPRKRTLVLFSTHRRVSLPKYSIVTQLRTYPRGSDETQKQKFCTSFSSEEGSWFLNLEKRNRNLEEKAEEGSKPALEHPEDLHLLHLQPSFPQQIPGDRFVGIEDDRWAMHKAIEKANKVRTGLYPSLFDGLAMPWSYFAWRIDQSIPNSIRPIYVVWVQDDNKFNKKVQEERKTCIFQDWP